MSAPYQSMDEETGCQKCCRQVKKCVLGTFCAVVVAVCLVQAVLYKWATMHCSASSLTGYEYPGGGTDDLVPRNSLLVEREPAWWGDSFINIPADDAGQPLGASTGVIFKTRGPIFNTYVYQDILGHQTFVVRDRPLALGGSHKIMRCDGEGPSYVFSEGSHWIMNNIREMFGMYTTRSFNIWRGSEKIAISEKIGGTGSSHKQIIFRSPDQDQPFASCFLKDRHYHGGFDEWFVQEYKNLTNLPAFIPHSCCALMAFGTALQKGKDSAQQEQDPKAFLEQVPTEASGELAEGDAGAQGASVGVELPAETAEEKTVPAATAAEATAAEQAETKPEASVEPAAPPVREAKEAAVEPKEEAMVAHV